MTTAQTHHFTLSNHGSVCMLAVHDEEAMEFLQERVPDDAQWWAGMLVIEPRYVEHIVNDLRENGWSVGLA